MSSPEFQAVVMAAGKGSRMTELLANKTKCLLPVGNLPMIWFPIHLLEKTGFQEVIVVILESFKSDVQAAIDRCNFKIKVEIFGISVKEDLGTADSLRLLQETNKIKTDVVVVSCDLITDVSLVPLLNLYRKHDASIAALFVQNTNASAALTVPGPKSKHKTERDFVGVNNATSRLVFIASASDYEESLPLSYRVLNRYGKVSLHTRLLDAHVYIINKWLCQYLTQNKNLSTLKGELIPYVVKKQASKGMKTKCDQDKASIIDDDIKTDITQFAQESELTLTIREMSTYTDNRFQPVYNNDSIRCYGHVVRGENAFALRANTLQQYWKINKEILERWSSLTNQDLTNISPSAVIKSTQLEKETCLVGEKSLVSEKTSVKSSFLGSSVTVSPKTRVLGSIVMSGVKIGEGCSIVNCIICEESVIEDGCDLKDCLVGSYHTVPSGGKYQNEVLTDVDRLMEI